MSKRELDALTTFSDPRSPEYKHHFMQFLGWFDDEEHLYIAMEFLEYGNLQKFIHAPFPEPEAASILAQVARALQYMHQKNFVYRDIKPLNILVSAPGPNWHVKVADFGITKKTDGTILATHGFGSTGYMAPELYGDLSDQYTPAVDVWALGAVAFCLRTCSPPFRTVKDLLDYARDHRVGIPLQILGLSSGFCVSFVLATLADLPERRLTIAHVLAHEWLNMQPGPTRGMDMTMSTAWSMSPSQAWSDTFRSTNSQHSRNFSVTTPMTDAGLDLPASRQGPSNEQQESGVRQLTIAQSEHELAENSSRDNPAPPQYQPPSMPKGDENSMRNSPYLPANQPPDMLKGMASLTTKYRLEKKYDRAEATAEDVLNLRREVFGNKHLDTIAALSVLATIYQEQEKYEKLDPIAKEILDLRGDLIGYRHPDTIQALENLGAVYFKTGKLDKAASAYEALFFVHRETFGEQSASALKSLDILNSIHDKEGKAFEASLRVEINGGNEIGKHTFRAVPDIFVISTVKDIEVHRTSTRPATYYPVWNEAFEIHADRDTVIIFRVYDEKRLSKNNEGALGTAGIQPSKLLKLRERGSSMILPFTLLMVLKGAPQPADSWKISTAKVTRSLYRGTFTCTLTTILPETVQPFTREGLPPVWAKFMSKSDRMYYIDYSRRKISLTKPEHFSHKPVLGDNDIKELVGRAL